MGAAAAVILIRERHVVEAFERARATAPSSARSPGELGVDVDGTGWRRLRERAIVRETEAGRFYLDVEVWQAVRRQRRRVLFALLIVMLAALVASGVFGRWFR